MKRFLFILLVTLPGFLSAQITTKEIGDFYLEDYTIIYHHVFVDSVPDSVPALGKKLMSTIALLPNIKNLVQSGNIITGAFDWVNSVTFGYSELKADFTIEIRNGRYRVTIFDFFQNNASNTLVPWDFTYVRDNKTEWRPSASEDLLQYDTKFTNMFALPLKQTGPAW